MSHATGLKCRECGTETPIAPLHVCETCFGPLEVQYDYDAIRRTLTRERHREPAAQSLALPRAAADRGRAAHRPALRLHAAGAGRPPGGRARRQGALGQGRLGQPPDLLVQGPRRVGRHLEGDRVRLRHRVVRLDRQPRQLGVGARRARRAQLLHLHPRRPRAGQGDRLDHLRPARRSRSAATTTTSTGCAARSPTSTAGRSSTSTCGRTTPRAPRPTASRSPSSSAGGCRSTSWCRWPAARSCRRSRKGFRELRDLGLVDGDFTHLRRPGRRLGAGDPGAAQGQRPDQPGEAAHHRQVDRHRQPGRRLLRAEGDPRIGRLGRDGRPTRRSSTASSCSRGPRASSPSRPAARRWP